MTVPPEHTSFTTDVAIVGAGPVGLFAVFQCGMLGMSCRVIDVLDAIGGQCLALYPEKPIYDIPACPVISGGDLIGRLECQAEPFDPHYHLNQQVIGLTGKAGDFHLTTNAGVGIDTKVVIIAAGTGAFAPRRPPLRGIETYEAAAPGSGVKYRVSRTADFAGRRVVIAGGGDSAVDWANLLCGIAESVSVVHRRARFRAMPESIRKMEALVDDGRINLVTPFQLSRLEGSDGTLNAVVVADLEGNEQTLKADVLLPFFGLSQELGPIRSWFLNGDMNGDMKDNRTGIPIDPTTAMTSRAGIYAIGDIADFPGKLKLILSGFAEAAAAAHHAYATVFPDKALHFEYSTTKGIPGAS